MRDRSTILGAMTSPAPRNESGSCCVGVEGSSLRSVTHMTGVHCITVMKLRIIWSFVVVRKKTVPLPGAAYLILSQH